MRFVSAVESSREFSFESFGVNITIESANEALLDSATRIARSALLDRIRMLENPVASPVQRFSINVDNKGVYSFSQNDGQVSCGDSEFIFLKYFDSMLRLAVAENAVGFVFVHAGVVCWRKKAVIFPARSHKGKSTLVAELLRNGASYFSDEYAIFDPSGTIHPFPRELTIRGLDGEYSESSISATDFGQMADLASLELGAVIITEYRDGADWSPLLLSTGRGIMETIPHVIPLHSATRRSLEVLNIAFEGAIIAKSYRGEAKTAAPEILAFLDKSF